jgi:hypothetical protein
VQPDVLRAVRKGFGMQQLLSCLRVASDCDGLLFASSGLML